MTTGYLPQVAGWDTAGAQNLTMGLPQRLWFSSRVNAGISERDGLEPFFAYSAAGLLVEN